MLKTEHSVRDGVLHAMESAAEVFTRLIAACAVQVPFRPLLCEIEVYVRSHVIDGRARAA